jgi:hypothetical protein
MYLYSRFSRHDIVNLVEDLIHANPHADGLGGGHGVLVMVRRCADTIYLLLQAVRYILPI